MKHRGRCFCNFAPLLLKASIFALVTLVSRLRDPFDARPWCERAPFVDCHSPANLAQEANETRLQVIVASYGHTGTTSLIHALRDLGFRAYHFEDVGVMARVALFDGIDADSWARTVSRCRMQAISLEPFNDLLPLALSVSPHTRVILTWRDFPSWLESTLSFGAASARTAFIVQRTASSKSVLPWVDVLDLLTGAVDRERREGAPVFPPSFWRYAYTLGCLKAWYPLFNMESRGLFKSHLEEEAYLAHMDEIRRATPPGRLLELDVRRQGWPELEAFLGMRASGRQGLPNPKNKLSRTRAPALDQHGDVALPVLLLFCGMHAANYLVVAAGVELAAAAIAACARLR